MKRCAICLTILLVATTLGVGWDISAGSPGPTFAEWVAAHGAPIATIDPGGDSGDLEPLRRIVGDARVVCFGESRHDASEQFRLKHRMIRFLVEEMGFSVIVFEESVAHAQTVDAYIQGGEADAAAILGDLCNWFAWDTREVLELVEWMRAYNADPAHEPKLRFFGVDCTAPRLGLVDALAYVEGLDTRFPNDFEIGSLGLSLFVDGDWPLTFDRYAALTDERKQAIGQAYDDLAAYVAARRSDFVRRSSAAEFDWAMRHVLVAQAAHGLYSSQSREEGGIIRDLAMADNLTWILEEQAPGEKVVVWAHNAHIARAPFTMPDALEGTLVDMIYHLSDRLGEDLVSIAGSCYEGEYDDSWVDPRTVAPTDTTYLGGALAEATEEFMLLDLRTAPEGSPAACWLHRERRMRGQGVDMVCVPADAYDAVYFVRTITRTEPGPRAQARFRSQRTGS
ncbi:erythromycin esterase family protein [bacterium]|nr:erythromycin esterase family protein [bacterium]